MKMVFNFIEEFNMPGSMFRLRRIAQAGLPIIVLLLAAACSGAQTASPGAPEAGKLNVVATTTIVGDIVHQVGGEHINLTILLRPGDDPHDFDPAPQEIARVADADILFASGAGLEATFLDRLMENAGSDTRLVEVSAGIQLLEAAGEHLEELSAEAAADPAAEHAGDPHTWMDPNNVMVWTRNIAAALQEADPQNKDTYAANAEAYIRELRDLDTWIREQVEAVPADRRELVTDHTVLTYFADEYGFEQTGALIRGYSSLAEPSAAELARLEDTIRQLDVKAVFVGNTVNPGLAQRVAGDTGTRLVFFYTGSLTEPGGEADSYLEFMRYNVNAIVQALQ